MNSLKEKVDTLLNCKNLNELVNNVDILVDEDPSLLNEAFEGKYHLLIEKFLNMSNKEVIMNNILERIIFPLLDSNKIIAELISRTDFSENGANLVRRELLFKLMAENQYFKELKELVYQEFETAQNNVKNTSKFSMYEIEKMFLIILGTIGDKKAQNLLEKASEEILTKKSNYEKRYGLYKALSLINMPKKARILNQLYEKAPSQNEKRQIIESVLTLTNESESISLNLLKKAKIEIKDPLIKNKIEEKLEQISAEKRTISSFPQLELKSAYDSDEDNILEDFFIKVLDNAVEYNRLTGSFSSSVLAVAARGIAGLIINKGTMKLIANSNLKKDDVQAILIGKKLTEESEKIITNQLLSDLASLESEIVRDHVAALGWLMANDFLDIKIIIMDNPDQTIFHQKVGILKDKENNMISFSGSVNESLTAWIGNIEEFKVYKSWIEGQIEYINSDLEKFNKYWNNDANRALVIDIPFAVKEKLISFAPDSSLEIKRRICKWLYFSDTKGFSQRLDSISWRKPQKKAYENWVYQNRQGILKIATGVGKTLIAIRAIYEYILEESNKVYAKIIAIALPNGLIYQWKEELEYWLVNEREEVVPWICYLHSDAKGTISDQIVDFEDKIKLALRKNEPVIVIAYYDTFSKKLIPSLNKMVDHQILFIADEVHEIGSKTRKKHFKNFFPKFRLGLSATPERYFDQAGTHFIYNYFINGIVYHYDIKNAIQDGLLCEYYYYPVICELSENERNDITEYNGQIQSLKNRIERCEDLKEKENLERKLELKYFDRARIIKKAHSKIGVTLGIVEELRKAGELRYCLIYTEDHEQLGMIYNKLIEDDYSVSKITEDILPIKKRADIIGLLREEMKRIVVAEKILDQGVNIPQLRYAIIMASTGNERQYIQRRGRLLRLADNKKYAIIYDLVIKEVDSELNRVKKFYDDCYNKQEVLEIIRESIGINIELNGSD